MNTLDTDSSSSSALREAFWQPGQNVQVQSVLYNNEVSSIHRAVSSMARATQLAVVAGACNTVTIRFGDSSIIPCLDPPTLAALREEFASSVTIQYDYFDGNLGSARGHNRLASGTAADFILVQNPDIVCAPRLLEVLLRCFKRSGVGMAEAKQVPIEHPKDYDLHTGTTSWATTACAMIPVPLFVEVGGFDAESFFLYCDDVDFSWLVRRAGYRVVFQPAAIAFHDKRLSRSGGWLPSGAEQYYSAEASLMLVHKWSRPDLLREHLAFFDASDDPNLLNAARHFRTREAAGTLPQPIDADHKVGEFNGVFFARHRYAL